MKRIISLCVVLVLILGLCACKKKKEELSVATPTDLATKTDIQVDDTISSTNSENASSAEDTCKHKFSAATCTLPKTCEKCDETEGEALGHKWNNPDCKTFKTCTVCKKMEPEKGAHKYKNGYCTVCEGKDPDYGTLTAHIWQTFKSPRLISISFKNAAFSESVMADMATMSDEQVAEIYENEDADIYNANGKEWYDIDGQGAEISYKEEDGKITVIFSDSDYPDEFDKGFVLERTGNTTLKVTECTLTGDFWKIRVGDVLTAVTN